MMMTSEMSSPYSLPIRFTTPKTSLFLTSAPSATTGESALRIFDASISHNRPHNLFLRDFFCGEFADKPAFVHDVRAVAHAKQLRHFRGNHDHTLTCRDHLIDDVVNLVLRSHIDTSRGLVENQYLGFRKQPLAQHHLLLVATRQVANDVGNALSTDPELL